MSHTALVVATVTVLLGGAAAWRRPRTLVAGLALAGVAFSVGGWSDLHKTGEQINDCGFAADGFELPSPQKDKIAILQDWVCAGGFGTGYTEYRIGIKDATQSSDAGDIVFKSNAKLGLTWTDDRKLDIHISELPEIKLSSHASGDTTITYSIANKLSKDNYEEKIAQYEERMKYQIANHVATFTHNENRDLQKLSEVVARWLDQYQHFEIWAQKNEAKFDEN
jgi:hypothetical protein